MAIIKIKEAIDDYNANRRPKGEPRIDPYQSMYLKVWKNHRPNFILVDGAMIRA